MNLPDEEMAKFVTPGWLKRVAEVPVDEIPAMVCEDPSVVTALVGALRHERKEAERLSKLVAGAAIRDISWSAALLEACDLFEHKETSTPPHVGVAKSQRHRIHELRKRAEP